MVSCLVFSCLDLVLSCLALCCVVLFCFVLSCFVLVLCCVVSSCVVLCCIILRSLVLTLSCLILIFVKLFHMSKVYGNEKYFKDFVQGAELETQDSDRDKESGREDRKTDHITSDPKLVSRIGKVAIVHNRGASCVSCILSLVFCLCLSSFVLCL